MAYARQGLTCGNHWLFGLFFSAILVVVSFVAPPQAFLVSDQFHLGHLIQIPSNCIPVGTIASFAFSWSIAGVVIPRIKTSFLLLLSDPESVVDRVVCLG